MDSNNLNNPSGPEEEKPLSPAFINWAMHTQYNHPYEVIPGTSHLLQVEKPDLCVAALVAYLAECGITPPATAA